MSLEPPGQLEPPPSCFGPHFQVPCLGQAPRPSCGKQGCECERNRMFQANWAGVWLLAPILVDNSTVPGVFTHVFILHLSSQQARNVWTVIHLGTWGLGGEKWLSNSQTWEVEVPRTLVLSSEPCLQTLSKKASGNPTLILGNTAPLCVPYSFTRSCQRLLSCHLPYPHAVQTSLSADWLYR